MERREFLKLVGVALVAPTVLAKASVASATTKVLAPLPYDGAMGIFNTELIQKVKARALQNVPKIKPYVINGKKYYMAYDPDFASELKSEAIYGPKVIFVDNSDEFATFIVD